MGPGNGVASNRGVAGSGRGGSGEVDLTHEASEMLSGDGHGVALGFFRVDTTPYWAVDFNLASTNDGGEA